MGPEELNGTTDTCGRGERAAMSALGLLQRITEQTGTLQWVADGAAFMRILLVNICFISEDKDSRWALIEAGLPGSAASIIEAAAELFGPGARPSSTVLIHGHFDHVGSVVELVERWDVPVSAHELEIPFLTGKADYPQGARAVRPLHT